MSKSDFTILVCCHKDDFRYAGEGYLPIHVGKANSSVDLSLVGDDTGDNISVKNHNYCELTAQYWLWKHLPQTPYVGLNHYRRYFDFNSKINGSYFYQNVAPAKLKEDRLSIPDNLTDLFETHDIVLAEPIVYPYPLLVQYILNHNKTDIVKLRAVIEELYPDYLQSFDSIMYGNKCSLCNMFIMRREEFARYSQWLFDILFTLEKQISIPKDFYQSRIFGFIGERLLNVYAAHNNLRIKHYPIIMISDSKPLNKSKGYMRNLLYNISNSIIKHSYKFRT